MRSNSRLVERRESSGGQVAGEYVYTGARLIQYTGSTLPSDSQPLSNVQLKFDLQGQLTSSVNLDQADHPVPNEQIGALRTRAQLLRSHALAQRSTSQHGSGH